MRAPLALALAGLLTLGACGEDEPRGGGEDLVVGVLLPTSGDTATFGEQCWHGVQIAADEIHAKDPAFRFRLVLNDEQSKKEVAGAQAKALIENSGAAIVVGSVASSNTMAAAIVCKEHGVPILTPASTNDALTDDPAKYGPDVFRVCFKDSFQGTMLARFAWKTLGRKKAVAVTDNGNAYSVGLTGQFEAEFLRLGGTVQREFFTQGDRDFSTVIQRVAEEEPDVVMISGYYAEGGAMIRQSKEAWKGIPVLGGDGLDSPALIPLAGETNADVYFTTHMVASDPDPVVQEFVRKSRDRFHGDPDAMAALGYDAMYAVYEAAKRAKPSGPYAPSDLARGLRGLEFTGVTGKIVIGPDRTPRKAIVVVKAEGRLKFVEKIQPD